MTKNKTAFAKEQLKAFIERIERLEEERKALADDVKEVFAEAKGTGFDTKIMRKVIAMRKLDKAEFQEQEAMLDLYLDAVGLDHTPLGNYAASRPAPAPVTKPVPAAPKVTVTIAAEPAPPPPPADPVDEPVPVEPPQPVAPPAVTAAPAPLQKDSAPVEIPAFLLRSSTPAKKAPEPVV